jgi:hypothetical protein
LSEGFTVISSVLLASMDSKANMTLRNACLTRPYFWNAALNDTMLM